jgi:glyoxylase-like metal-dependent hydrolase (beta-lactamase superfamily II)
VVVTSIDPVLDAQHPVPPGEFFDPPPSAGQDWQTAPPWFDGAGWIMPMGGFLLRSGDRTILVDAGLGPNIDIVETRGKLFDSLADLGVTPEQITDVVLTHLHLDHVGWVAPAGEPIFTHARHHCHRADYDWMRADPGSNPATARVTDTIRAVSDLLDLAEGERTEIADSVALRLFAGHTPGNCVGEIETGEARVLLLGDTAHHPALLVEDGWTDRLDEDRAAAARARDRLAQEMERTGAIGLGAHFPGIQGGRIIRDKQGARQWQPIPSNRIHTNSTHMKGIDR